MQFERIKNILKIFYVFGGETSQRSEFQEGIIQSSYSGYLPKKPVTFLNGGIHAVRLPNSSGGATRDSILYQTAVDTAPEFRGRNSSESVITIFLYYSSNKSPIESCLMVYAIVIGE